MKDVYYKELEQYLLRHPAVQDAAIVTVIEQDYDVAAYVVPKPGVFDPERLRVFFHARLSALKIRGYIEYRQNLPRSATGKLYRRELSSRSSWDGAVGEL